MRIVAWVLISVGILIGLIAALLLLSIIYLLIIYPDHLGHEASGYISVMVIGLLLLAPISFLFVFVGIKTKSS